MSTYKRDIKPRTREEYQRQHRTYIAPIIGAKPLEAVTPEDCQEIINAAAAKGERIAQAVYALLRAAFRRAVRSRRLLWSPMDAVDRPRHKSQQGNALTESDYMAAVPEISDDLALSLALFAGLRRAEITGLGGGEMSIYRTTCCTSGEFDTASAGSSSKPRRSRPQVSAISRYRRSLRRFSKAAIVLQRPCTASTPRRKYSTAAGSGFKKL